MRNGFTVGLLLVIALSGCEIRRSVIEGKLLALGVDTPLPKVTLRIAGKTDTITALAITDSDGKFLFDRLRANETYRIESADTAKFLISPVEVTIAKGEKKHTAGTLRGIVTPPGIGLWAWVKGTWRELSPIRVNRSLTMLRTETDKAQTVPQSASLIAWFPGKTWGGEGDSTVQWVGGMIQDTLVRFTEIALRENTPDDEPEAMDPTTFTDWNYPGVYPVRGPFRPGLYAVVQQHSERNDATLYPFWVPSSGSDASTQAQSLAMSMLTSKMGGFTAPPGFDTSVIYQRALQAAMRALNLSPDSQFGGGNTSVDSILGSPSATASGALTSSGKSISIEQATRWREQLRNAIADRDTFRRRQLWKAIRDSAEGTDIALDADRLLIRDLNGLPLR